MQRRAFERISATISARCCSQNAEHAGTVTNLSEKGMFICIDNLCFPFDRDFNVILPLEEEILAFPVSIRRVKKTGDQYEGVGVEIPDPPDKYRAYVADLRNSPGL